MARGRDLLKLKRHRLRVPSCRPWLLRGALPLLLAHRNRNPSHPTLRGGRRARWITLRTLRFSTPVYFTLGVLCHRFFARYVRSHRGTILRNNDRGGQQVKESCFGQAMSMSQMRLSGDFVPAHLKKQPLDNEQQQVKILRHEEIDSKYTRATHEPSQSNSFSF